MLDVEQHITFKRVQNFKFAIGIKSDLCNFIVKS